MSRRYGAGAGPLDDAYCSCGKTFRTEGYWRSHVRGLAGIADLAEHQLAEPPRRERRKPIPLVSRRPWREYAPTEDEWLAVRFAPGELDLLKVLAATVGENVTDWVRALVLRAAEPSPDAQNASSAP